MELLCVFVFLRSRFCGVPFAHSFLCVVVFVGSRVCFFCVLVLVESDLRDLCLRAFVFVGLDSRVLRPRSRGITKSDLRTHSCEIGFAFCFLISLFSGSRWESNSRVRFRGIERAKVLVLVESRNRICVLVLAELDLLFVLMSLFSGSRWESNSRVRFRGLKRAIFFFVCFCFC